jgi:HK97 gp10 family phage protein
MFSKEDRTNRQARRDLVKLRHTLDNMRGVANDRLVDDIMRKGGKVFTRSIRRQIKAKGWSNGAVNQVEVRKMGQKFRATFRGGTYTYLISYDTPKGSKTAPYMRFQDWGTGNRRTKTIWHDVEGEDYKEWEDIKVKTRGIPPQHFSRTAWRLHHRKVERFLLGSFVKQLRKMSKTQRKVKFGKLEQRVGWDS